MDSGFFVQSVLPIQPHCWRTTSLTGPPIVMSITAHNNTQSYALKSITKVDHIFQLNDSPEKPLLHTYQFMQFTNTAGKSHACFYGSFLVRLGMVDGH